MRTLLRLCAALALTLAAQPAYSQSPAPDLPPRTAHAIFIHPDGTALNQWNAARAYWQGPDGALEWDRLPELAPYRGHLTDALAATSHGGGTAHAFGVKVAAAESFGTDSPAEGDVRPLTALSGYRGSILREAAAAGHPVGLVNDGDAAEPGTAAFFAEAPDRDDEAEIVRQLIDGRPGFEGEALPDVVLGGGEAFFLPEGTPRCADAITPDCAVHIDPLDGAGPARKDGRNLIAEAIAQGWTVIRARAEFDALTAQLAADPAYAPRVLGLFAADDLFNDAPEEVLAAAGLVEAGPLDAEQARGGPFLLWGDRPGAPGFAPPSAAEMATMALTILERRSAQVGLPFLLVAEVESADNFAGSNNAIGVLRSLRAADALIGVARAFQQRVPRTLVLTAADSDAGGMQVVSPPPTDEAGLLLPLEINPNGMAEQAQVVALDGLRGRGTEPFVAAPDAAGRALPFMVAWTGLEDVAGGVVVRAQGRHAALLHGLFAQGFDNTDVYRLLYYALFGDMLRRG